MPPQTGHLWQGNLSDNYVSAHPATAPNFIKVASHPLLSSLQTEVVSSLPQEDTQVSPQSLGVAVPQSTMGGAQATNVAVSSTLPSVPGYLVDRIKLGHFVDFTLLTPCNLKHLPVAEPSAVHLAKLAKSELQPIRTFQDWSEAWAVHGAIIAQKCPEKAADHFSYFLLLASAHRDIPGVGWLVYDVAFRKHAAEKDSVIWGEVMPTLWMTTRNCRSAYEHPYVINNFLQEELSAGTIAGPFCRLLVSKIRYK